jgi:hypothetical protein
MTTEIINQKVSLINDINKLNLLLCKKNISTEEFDTLYDYTIEELEETIFTGEQAVRLNKNLDKIKELILEQRRISRGLEDGN